MAVFFRPIGNCGSLPKNKAEPATADFLMNSKPNSTGDEIPVTGKTRKSTKYIPVRCVACGWEDGLREDIVAKGDLTMYCDSCSDVRPVELISPKTQAKP